jgi:hypothetical protein
MDTTRPETVILQVRARLLSEASDEAAQVQALTKQFLTV